MIGVMVRAEMKATMIRDERLEMRDRAKGISHHCLLISYLILLLLVFAVMPAYATVLTAVMKTPYFTVHYDPSDQFLAKSTADTAQDELMRIAKNLGYNIEPNLPFPLMVYRTHYSFIQEGGLKDRFTVGTARTGDERICVDASGAFVTMQQVLAHEITHAVVFRILGDRAQALPMWANEGLAKYESDDYPDRDANILSDAAANGTLMSLSDLESSFPEDNSGLAYAESASAMRFLVKRYGASAPKKMLTELAASGLFEKAIVKATDESESVFISRWTNSLSKQYWFLRVSTIAGAFGGAAMAGLVVIAFIIRRRKMAQAAREWEWEQFDESMGRQLKDWPHR